MRARIVAAQVSEHVVTRYRAMGGGWVAEEDREDREPGAAVAVRSSATGEDAAEASLARL
jgi:hypothetical protein